MAKAEAKAQLMWKMFGWEQLYDTAIEHKWYEGLERTPFESVFYAEFEDLIYNISKLNLK